jgi:hypothetical protein
MTTDIDSEKYLRGLHVRKFYRDIITRRLASRCQPLPLPDDLIAEIMTMHPKLTRDECIEHKPADLILLALERELLNDPDFADIDRWIVLIEAMIATSANSLDGIRAKARFACWLRLGDLDEAVVDSSAPPKDKTLENSILADLIRLYDPHLERKGAVQALARMSPPSP